LTAPGEVVTVVHQAPVVAYYADRPYALLYTLSLKTVTAVLEDTTVLVWDAPTFLAMSSEEVTSVQASVTADFVVQDQVSVAPRSVTIYKRKVKQ
jgi:hypothetical protein